MATFKIWPLVDIQQRNIRAFQPPWSVWLTFKSRRWRRRSTQVKRSSLWCKAQSQMSGVKPYSSLSAVSLQLMSTCSSSSTNCQNRINWALSMMSHSGTIRVTPLPSVIEFEFKLTENYIDALFFMYFLTLFGSRRMNSFRFLVSSSIGWTPLKVKVKMRYKGEIISTAFLYFRCPLRTSDGIHLLVLNRIEIG